MEDFNPQKTEKMERDSFFQVDHGGGMSLPENWEAGGENTAGGVPGHSS